MEKINERKPELGQSHNCAGPLGLSPEYLILETDIFGSEGDMGLTPRVPWESPFPYADCVSSHVEDFRLREKLLKTMK